MSARSASFVRLGFAKVSWLVFISFTVAPDRVRRARGYP